jgi:hypothetical protein
MGSLSLHITTHAPEGFLSEYPLGEKFYASIGHKEIPDFEFGYLVAQRDGFPEAIIPYFVTRFKFNTMLNEGWLKNAMGNLGLPIACIGHPVAPFGRIDGKVSDELFKQVFEVLKTRAPLVALKGFGPDLPATGFAKVIGLPVAVLKLHENFWQMLKSNRRNLKRKMKAASDLRFETVTGLPEEYREQVFRLYLNSYNKAEVRFECLSAEYFKSTALLSTYLLVYMGEEIVGFIQMIQKGKRMAALYMGLEYSVNKKLGVYFAMTMKAVEYAIARGCSEIELGETNYSFKKALGSDLIDTWVYFRHRNIFANYILARFAFLFAPSQKDLA